MKYYGKITDDKDLITKEYVDEGLDDKQDALTIDTLTTSTTELSYLIGTTSNIQTQINSISGRDYVVDQGTSSTTSGTTWLYRKWNNGVAELWGTRTGTASVGDNQVADWFPVEFTAKPACTANIMVDSTVNCYVRHVNALTTYIDSYFYSASANSYCMSFYMIGRWYN